jgi:hypothetical protein
MDSSRALRVWKVLAEASCAVCRAKRARGRKVDYLPLLFPGLNLQSLHYCLLSARNEREQELFFTKIGTYPEIRQCICGRSDFDLVDGLFHNFLYSHAGITTYSDNPP